MLLAASLIATALCAGCGEAHFPTKLGPARPLAVATDGPPSALYAPLYAADANGDFKRGALAVTITAGSPARALAALESHRAAVAIVSEPELLAARDGGARVVAIGALVRQPLDGIVSNSTRPVASVAALSQRTIAVAPGALTQAELATALSGAHLATGAVKTVPLRGDALTALSGKGVAATIGADWATAKASLAQHHQQAHVLQIQQLGVPGYSQLVIAVRVDEAHYDGPLLRAFLQSVTRGQRALTANPAAAAATLAKLNPRIGARVERAAIVSGLSIAGPRSTVYPYGYQDPREWAAFGRWMGAHHLLAHAASAAAAITDEFLPGQGE